MRSWGRMFISSPNRGSIPGSIPADLGTQLRLDEYALRITPWSDGRFNLQVGKFSTVVGGWVERHLSWDNPFVNAPLPYETATLVSDEELPLTGQSFRAVPGFDKYEFLPMLWGPVYATGISVAGRFGIFEYAAEVKNAPVASRPESWDDFDFGYPSVDLRVGLRPNEAWRFGFSAAEGSYLQANARPLPIDSDLSEYRQFVLGQDVSYARGHLQIWAEAFEGRFEVPAIGQRRRLRLLRGGEIQNHATTFRRTALEPGILFLGSRPGGPTRGQAARCEPGGCRAGLPIHRPLPTEAAIQRGPRRLYFG